MSVFAHRYTRHGYRCCAQASGPPPPGRARCGGPGLCSRCAGEVSGCPARNGKPAPATAGVHRYSRHGWACCAQAAEPPPRVPIAKCGGPLVCQRCGRDVAACPAFNAPGGIDFAALQALHHVEHPNLSQVTLSDDVTVPVPGLGDVLSQITAAHHILDRLGVDVGQGFRGDLDARMWLLMGQVEAMADALARIGEQHGKKIDSHGGTDGACHECGLMWPCPTHVWATTRRGPCDPWDDKFSI